MFSHKVVRQTPTGAICKAYKYGECVGTFFLQYKTVKPRSAYNCGVNVKYHG